MNVDREIADLRDECERSRDVVALAESFREEIDAIDGAGGAIVTLDELRRWARRFEEALQPITEVEAS